MISKQQIKTIHSLRLKKYRDQSGLFVGEGPKVVAELLQSFECTYIAALQSWLEANQTFIPAGVRCDTLQPEELAKTSMLEAPQQVIAIFRKQPDALPTTDALQSELCLALDTVQDPGNLGTILRLARWFGINHVICSPTTADIYSPKVVQATMGALGKVKVAYTPLPQYLASLSNEIPVYGTFLDGTNIYDAPLTSRGIIVMGNEGNGISQETASHITQRLYIPPYPMGSPAIESLNVGVATAITCAEFRRRIMPIPNS
ncbi:MAG: RNA methyltransferase [Bacteroidaceae bacterium]|nr:RNA methyltransferase [Bacteroidaceae bacterium]